MTAIFSCSHTKERGAYHPKPVGSHDSLQRNDPALQPSLRLKNRLGFVYHNTDSHRPGQDHGKLSHPGSPPPVSVESTEIPPLAMLPCTPFVPIAWMAGIQNVFNMSFPFTDAHKMR